MTYSRQNRRGWLLAIERILLAAGILLLSFYLAAKIHSIITFRATLRDFQNRNVTTTTLPEPKKLSPGSSTAASEAKQAVSAGVATTKYPKSVAKGTALAMLRIPRLKLEVPVLDGTDWLTLNSGAGRIAGTAFPGERGNIGIAGHRDSFFRKLKDVGKGDIIELVVRQQVDSYVVDSIGITGPEDTSVLDQDSRPELTLVTCYPFRFIGPAPKRFIVRATLLHE